MLGISENKRWNSDGGDAGIPSGSMLRIPRSRLDEPSAAIRLLFRESVIENSRLFSLSPFSFSTRAMFSFCQRSQSVSAPDTSARLPRRATASGRQSTASMSFSAHSSQLPAMLFHVRIAASREKLVSGGNLGSVQSVCSGVSIPRMVMSTVTEGRAVISASSISTACLPPLGWSQGDSKLSRQRMHCLDLRAESTLSKVVQGWRRASDLMSAYRDLSDSHGIR